MEGSRVDELMAATVFVAEVDEPVSYVRDLMHKRGIHAVPVVDHETRLVGIVTAGDLVEQLPDGIAVSRVMSSRVHTCHRSDTVRSAARAMLEHRVHHLVVTDEGEIVGIVSSFDLLRVIADDPAGA